MPSTITDRGIPVAEGVQSREREWAWGLLLSVGLCLLFWGLVILGLTVII